MLLTAIVYYTLDQLVRREVRLESVWVIMALVVAASWGRRARSTEGPPAMMAAPSS
jgi:hypothetical protein